MMNPLSQRIADLGRVEMKHLLDQDLWHEHTPAFDSSDDPVTITKSLTRSMKEALNWWSEQDPAIANSISNTLDQWESKPEDAVIAMDPLSTAAIAVPLTTLITFSLGLWYKVWHTKFAAKAPIKAELSYDEETATFIFEGEGLRLPSGEVPSISMASLIGKLKEGSTAAKAITDILNADSDS